MMEHTVLCYVHEGISFQILTFIDWEYFVIFFFNSCVFVNDKNSEVICQFSQSSGLKIS